MKSYFIQQFDPINDPIDPWPNGGWSLYRITGDEIALRIQFNPKTGEVMHRHAWPGFVGCFTTLAAVMDAIEQDKE